MDYLNFFSISPIFSSQVIWSTLTPDLKETTLLVLNLTLPSLYTIRNYSVNSIFYHVKQNKMLNINPIRIQPIRSVHKGWGTGRGMQVFQYFGSLTCLHQSVYMQESLSLFRFDYLYASLSIYIAYLCIFRSGSSSICNPLCIHIHIVSHSMEILWSIYKLYILQELFTK